MARDLIIVNKELSLEQTDTMIRLGYFHSLMFSFICLLQECEDSQESRLVHCPGENTGPDTDCHTLYIQQQTQDNTVNTQFNGIIQF